MSIFRSSRRRLVSPFAGAVLACVVLLGACSKTEPPPPPKVAPAPAAAAPAPDTGIQRLAAEAYVFAFPLVVTDVAKEIATAKTPINTFGHTRSLRDASSTDTPDPNADVLFSTAWLDLSKEPLVLSVPDTRGRYYVLPMTDAWTNVFSSPGKRETGTEKRDFVLVGPRFTGKVPDELVAIKAPTETVLIVGRTETTGKADYAAAAKVQDEYLLTPLSQYGRKPAKGGRPAPKVPVAAGTPAAAVDAKTPPSEQVAKMDAQTFFTRVALLLPSNPPAKEDAAMVEKMKALGIAAGQPFDATKPDPARAQAIEEGIKTARAAIVTSSKGSLGELKNGWTIHRDLGRYGTNYGLRAVRALLGLGANAPEDAVLAATRFDGGGKQLNGANRYVMHFNPGQTPATEAFWALSVYDDKRHFVPNPLERYAIGTHDRPRANPDGSVDIHIASVNPGGDRESNWLPAPKGDFNVMLRTYWPKPEMLDPKWAPPPIQLVN